MKKRSVLVVESGTRVGSELSRTLHELYPSWSVAAADPAVAVSVLRDGGVDTIVSLAREGCGANTLADWIEANYPSISHTAVEIGESESFEGGLSDLAQRIGRSLALQGRLAGPGLAGVAAGLKRIPVVSSVYEDMCYAVASDLVAGDASSPSEIVELVCHDPGLAGQILRAANSSTRDGGRSLSSITEAVTFLGSSRISSLLLGMTDGDQIRPSAAAGGVVERDWHDAILTARLSRKIAAHEQATTAGLDGAYLAGLLHNVGRLVLAANLPQQFAAVEWPSRATARLALEEEVFGVRHTDLGGLLVGLWGLDDEISEAVAFYTDPAEGASRALGPLAAVHGAAVLLGRGGLNWDKEFLLKCGLADRIEKWASLLGTVPQAVASAGF